VADQRKKLAVDMADICIALDSAAGDLQWYLDVETGDTLLVNNEYDPVEEGVTLEEIEARPERYLAVPHSDRGQFMRDMKDFTVACEDAVLKESLEIALVGQAPARRFKAVLSHLPEQRNKWFEFRRARLLNRAVRWLDQNGIEPVPRGRR
jgi:hypothetical protein